MRVREGDKSWNVYQMVQWNRTQEKKESSQNRPTVIIGTLSRKNTWIVKIHRENLSEKILFLASHLEGTKPWTLTVSSERSFTEPASRQHSDNWAVRGKDIAPCVVMSFGRPNCWRNLRTLGRLCWWKKFGEPVEVGSWNPMKKTRSYTCQVVQDFCHQQ